MPMLIVTTAGFLIDHVMLEPRDQVLRLLAADADVDHLRELQVGVLRRREGIDRQSREVPPPLCNRVADGDDLVSLLQLQLVREVFGGRSEDRKQGDEQRSQLSHGSAP